ncbi:MAG: hypothetical protein AAGA66_17635, partial [Bacteroidota bacterium]
KILRTLASDTEKSWNKIEMKEGMNIAKWDLRLANIEPAEGVYVPSFGNMGMQGYHVGPGRYSAKLTIGDFSQVQEFEILKDPRDEVSEKAIADQERLKKTIYENLEELYESLKQLQDVRQQVGQMIDREEGDEEIQEMGDGIKEKVGEIEKELISPEQETFQDIINFRNKLDIQLYQLMQTIDGSVPPLTNGEQELYEDLKGKWNTQKEGVQKILNEDIPAFNKLLRDKGVEYIAPKKKSEEDKVGL